MSQREPLNPTIETLHSQHSLTLRAELQIDHMREKVNAVLGNKASELLVIVGPCAMTSDQQLIQHENNKIAALDMTNDAIVALHRMPPWKPRTNPNDWFGLGTTDPELAFKILNESAEMNGNTAIELGHIGHLARYSDRLALGWVGARNDDNSELIHAVATHDMQLPIAVKNSLDGTADVALEHIKTIRELRQKGERNREVALLYRGGSKFDTPDAWEDQLLAVIDQAQSEDISVIVDVAHGSEMAHHPAGRFEKSVEGQAACLEHLGMIAIRDGTIPHGIMIEASDAKSPTDPVIPFDLAINLSKSLARIKRSQTSIINDR